MEQAQIERLTYNGRVMSDRTTIEEAPADVARALLLPARQLMVQLEPGDATRYTLYLIRLTPHDLRRVGYEQGTLLVVRDLGGRQLAQYVPPMPHITDVSPLTNGNEWTARFLHWWLTLVFVELERLRG
jgi:hypothetical protein